jgi:uncharacterized protein (TIGR01777 family)
MKVLLTGATGLVGSQITQLLTERGIAVNYFTRKLPRVPLLGSRAFLWNPDRMEWDPEALHEVTHVINLAGSTIAKRWTPAYKTEVTQSRVNSLLTLQRALEQQGRASQIRVLSASAIGCYASDFEYCHTEDSLALGNDFLAQVVSSWEAAALALTPLVHSLSVVRIGIVLDAEQGALPKLLAPIKWGLGAPLGTGNQWQSWIHIKDLARLFVFLLEHDLGPIVNGVAPSPVRQAALTAHIAKTLRKPLWLPAVPSLLLRLLLGEMSTVVLASQCVSSERLEDSDFHFEFPSLDGALSDLLRA